MTEVNVNDFINEKECLFEDERYSVRDNGAIFRHSREGKRNRKSDEQWTFGIENLENGYLHISSVRVHRIVATAFHGDPPDPKYVVDHIDTNRHNNRPENLRWLTRLENTLQNPVTRKKIEYLCGSIEAFLENPSMLNDRQLEPSYSWMRTVTKEEATNCKNRMAIWASQENKIYKARSDRYIDIDRVRASYEKSMFKPLNKFDAGFGREPGLDITKTMWSAAYMFAPNYFHLCPDSFKSDRLQEYFQNIKVGKDFASTENDENHPELSYSLKVIDSIIRQEKQLLVVFCERTDKKFVIVGIELYNKNQWFIHYNLGAYSDLEIAQQRFVEAQKFEVKDFYNEAYKHQRDL